VILADIATAQELTGMLGSLSRIDLILPEGDAQAVQRCSLAAAGLPVSGSGAQRHHPAR
jgi:hypothetical protein